MMFTMIKLYAFLVLLTAISSYAQQASDITTGFGAPVSYKDASLTVGRGGPMLLEDTEFIDEMAHFDRERIPERVVHAKGGGAFGYFEVTNDITRYCAASLFSRVGDRTRIAVRFSTVAGESGSPDTARDPRGFAIKFYTQEGNWDLVGNNLPVFFIRDSILFPSFIHSQKRHPSTFLHDADMQWDFFTSRPEVTHMLLYLFSDRGTPDGFRFMHGFGVNTFKLINATGHHVYCKFHYLSNQGLRNLTAKVARQLQVDDPDYSLRDLYNAIKSKKYPSWTLYIQVMTEAQALNSSFNPFDDTKLWPEDVYPLIPVGRLVLNENPTNYFQDIEQIALSPSRMVPGIKPSPDRMLQGRLFSYPDTQRYRLGPNFLQIPVNCPLHVRNYQRDGPMSYNNQGDSTVYHPNSAADSLNVSERAGVLSPAYFVNGDVSKYDNGGEDNFSQAANHYQNVLDEGGRVNLVKNLGSALSSASEMYQRRALDMFGNVSPDLKARLQRKLGLQ
ncbi:catalase-like isoform X1 [Agrilus planipennis]|uniref:Catalase n=2 Tax=Agrilus planipennis TaxID=224129 RepID=A0A1W4W9Y9_AGRPL|nr:catalase-like isoform X1 [Agrilus planipennis]